MVYKNKVFCVVWYGVLAVLMLALPLISILSAADVFVGAGLSSSGMSFLIGVLFLILLFLGVRHLITVGRETGWFVPLVLFFLLATVGMQIFMVTQIKVVPQVDLRHIYREALSMLDAGVMTNASYFAYNTNNIAITIVIYWMMKGIRLVFGQGADYRLWLGILNILAVDVSIFFLYKIVERIRDKEAGMVCVFLALINPIFFAYLPYYYTDTLCMPFMMMGIYLIIRWEDNREKRNYKEWVLLILAGVALFTAAKIRSTMIIPIIAVAVYWVFRGEYRVFWKKPVMVLTGLVIGIFLWKGVYQAYIPFDTTEHSMAPTHWVMMGLQGNGTYLQEDVDFSRSFDTREEQIEGNIEEIKNRLNNLGIPGTAALLVKKAGITWGDGAHGYRQYLRYCESYTPLYRLIEGDRSTPFEDYCNAYTMFLLLGTLYYTVTVWKKKTWDASCMFLILIFGAILFHMMWEAHPRHSTAFLPFLTIFTVLCEPGRAEAYQVKRGCVGLLACFLAFAGLEMSWLMRVQSANIYSVYIDKKAGKATGKIKGGQTLRQTFETANPFNQVTFWVKAPAQGNTAAYSVSILDESGQVTALGTLAGVGESGYYSVEFEPVVPEQNTKYTIELSMEPENGGKAAAFYRFYQPYYDVLPSGELTLDGEELDGDLSMTVRYTMDEN